MTLENYLQSKLSKSTAKIYLFEINHFKNYLGELKAESANYSEVMDYILKLRRRYDNPGTIHRIIHAIKQYFFYLIEEGKREDHPCRYLSIKDRSSNQIQIQDLLKTEELEKLLERKERYEILKIKNQMIMSLLIYQALRVKEICELGTKNLDLEKGKIKIKGSSKTNGRTLNLKPNQILLFYKYLNEIRPKLIKVKTKKLIITKKGSAEKGEGIHYLVSTFRKMFPSRRLTPTTIRQSVIANLLAEGNDLRIVQVFAGHKKTSATEKYRQTNLDALKESIQKFHPLK